MLIRLQELVRAGGVLDFAAPLALNPLVIDSVRPGTVPGHEVPACKLEIQGQDEPTYVSGDFDSVLGKIQGVEPALKKLHAIAEIVTGE